MPLNQLEDPANISGMITDKAQFGTIFHQPGQLIQRLAGYKPAALMPCFWPGVKEQDENTPYTIFW